MSTTAGLMTVEEFRQLPDSNRGVRYELHHGELVELTRPKYKHWFLQNRISDLFRRCGEESCVIGYEFGFRPYPEHELWAADVAYVSAERARAMDFDDNLRGAPVIVVEVLSPSNTVSEINDREAICLDTGCREFWVVDPRRKLIKISTPDRKTTAYRTGDRIVLTLFGGQQIGVDEIFEGIR